MIQSMTPKEREDPELLASTPSRRRRIARGSGRKEVDVSNMIARFSQMRSKMKDMSRMMNMSGAKGQLQYLTRRPLLLPAICLSLDPFGWGQLSAPVRT